LFIFLTTPHGSLIQHFNLTLIYLTYFIFLARHITDITAVLSFCQRQRIRVLRKLTVGNHWSCKDENEIPSIATDVFICHPYFEEIAWMAKEEYPVDEEVQQQDQEEGKKYKRSLLIKNDFIEVPKPAKFEVCLIILI